MSNLQKNAVGVNIVLTVIDQDDAVVDLSVAETKAIVFERPNNATFERFASLVTDGTDGRIYYTTVADDLDQAGVWKLQAKVRFFDGFDGKSNRVSMRVEKNAGD